MLWFLPNPVKFIFEKNIHLVEDYSFKYLGCMGRNTNRAIV